MPSIGLFLTNIRRAETPFYAFLYRTAKSIFVARLPVPDFMKPLFRGVYHLHFTIRGLYMRAMSYFYWEPIFRARCDSAGKNLVVTLLPDIDSNVHVILGDNVRLNGHIGIMSGKWFKAPRLVVHDNVHIGHLVSFTINREIVIEEGVMIASNCYFADTDAHPVDHTMRIAGLPPSEDRVRPVRLCRNAWIGHSCHILKGVTVGEASIVAAGSVVVEDVPSFSIVAGNPARVISARRREASNQDSLAEPSAPASN